MIPIEAQVLWTWFSAKLSEQRNKEAGLTTTEYVILGAGVATVCLVVVGIVTVKLTSKANSIPMD